MYGREPEAYQSSRESQESGEVFSKLSSWEGKVVAFTRDVVEDILPPTVLIKEEW